MSGGFDEEDYNEEDYNELLEPHSIKGIPGPMGVELYKLLHKTSFSEQDFALLMMQLSTNIRNPNGIAQLWQYFGESERKLFTKKIATLIEAGNSEGYANQIHTAYEIIVRLSRNAKPQPKTYTDWILKCDKSELKSLHGIFTYLVRHHKHYKNGPPGVGYLWTEKK